MTPDEQLQKIRELCGIYYTGNAAGLNTPDLVWFTLQQLAERVQTARLIKEQLAPKPATFEAHGLRWIPHKPGDPMPCDSAEEVRVLITGDELLVDSIGDVQEEREAGDWNWNKSSLPEDGIIGWNYADPAKEVRA